MHARISPGRFGMQGRLLRQDEEQPLGTNKRYAARVDVQMGARANESVMRDGTPDTLTDRELMLDVEPVTRTPRPVPVLAWVRCQGVGMRVEARVVDQGCRD